MGPALVIYSSLNVVKVLTTVSLPSDCIGGQVSLQLFNQRAALFISITHKKSVSEPHSQDTEKP